MTRPKAICDEKTRAAVDLSFLIETSFGGYRREF